MKDDEGTSGSPNEPTESSASPNDPPENPNDSPDGPADEPPESDEGWRFTLADIERREAEATAEAEARARRSEPIEPGEPSLEGTAFVLLGVVFTLFIISRLLVG